MLGVNLAFRIVHFLFFLSIPKVLCNALTYTTIASGHVTFITLFISRATIRRYNHILTD